VPVALKVGAEMPPVPEYVNVFAAVRPSSKEPSLDTVVAAVYFAIWFTVPELTVPDPPPPPVVVVGMRPFVPSYSKISVVQAFAVEEMEMGLTS
jgi:hypothetical protein